jgi:hypothetical protein
MQHLRLATLIAAVIAASLSTRAAAAEDLILRQRIDASGKKAGRVQTQYYSASVRITDDERFRSIVDLDKKTVISINKEDHTYSVTSFEELAKRRSRHDDRVNGLPPKVREMVHADEVVTVTPTGKTDLIAGYEAREFKVEGRTASGKVWVAESLDFGGRRAEWDRVAVLFGGERSPGGQLAAAMAKLKGVPLRRSVRLEPLPLVNTEVIEVRRGPIPADLRRVPEGFTKIEASKPGSRRKRSQVGKEGAGSGE